MVFAGIYWMIFYVNVFLDSKEKLVEKVEQTSYKGPKCKTILYLDIDECEPYPCAYDAKCVDLVNDYSCECPPGVIGKNCDTGNIAYYEKNY